MCIRDRRERERGEDRLGEKERLSNESKDVETKWWREISKRA